VGATGLPAPQAPQGVEAVVQNVAALTGP